MTTFKYKIGLLILEELIEQKDFQYWDTLDSTAMFEKLSPGQVHPYACTHMNTHAHTHSEYWDMQF